MASNRPNGEFYAVERGSADELAGRGVDVGQVIQLLDLGCQVLANYDPTDDIQLIAYAPVELEQDSEFVRRVDELLLACVQEGECDIVGDADQCHPDNGRYLLVM